MPSDPSRPVDEPADWDAWFAWIEHPALHPLADYECRTCGKVACTDEHEADDG